MEPIQIIGVKELDEFELPLVNKLANEYYQKIQRELQNVTSVVIHIKSYEKEGKRKKYSIHVRVIAPTRIFESSKAQDWDLARTLHKAFRDIERELQHKLHTDDQRPKRYG